MRRRDRARDGLDAIRSRSSRRERDHRSRERSSIVGDRARSSVTARGSRSIRSRSGRSRDPRRARVNHINQRETPYLGDDGGARGDAFLRARGSRRERDQSGVQRQGDHDCVCVTSRVESLIHVIHSFIRIHARGRSHAGRGDRQTHTVWVRTQHIVPHPCPRRDPLHFIPSPSPSRSRSRWGGSVVIDRCMYSIGVCNV